MSQHAPSRLIVDIKALQDNYRLLAQKSSSTAAVVKANAYGLGVDIAVPALEQAGANFFYVAQFDEALTLRQYTQKPIAVLGGLAQGAAADYQHHKIIPVLNSAIDIERCPATLPSIWHIDTGMNRLGLSPSDVATLASRATSLPVLMMTHFTSSDDVGSHFAAEQVHLFDAAITAASKPFHSIPQSICNSSGIFRDATWHRAQTRAGIALYGGNPTPETTNPMQSVVTLEAKILQTRAVKAGETAGYNQTYTFPKDTTIATVGLGYADGFLRAGSSRAKFYWHGEPCPIVGRVSMDLIIVDIGHVNAPAPQQDDWLEILGPHQSVDQLAVGLGTIGYEVLTSLSRRAERKSSNQLLT